MFTHIDIIIVGLLWIGAPVALYYYLRDENEKEVEKSRVMVKVKAKRTKENK